MWYIPKPLFLPHYYVWFVIDICKYVVFSLFVIFTNKEYIIFTNKEYIMFTNKEYTTYITYLQIWNIPHI